MPRGAGYLPAFWLMAEHEEYYGKWPCCGEIDICEIMGSDTGRMDGACTKDCSTATRRASPGEIQSDEAIVLPEIIGE